MQSSMLVVMSSGNFAEPPTVVVTGAADGIGRAIAEAFVEVGGRVHLLDVDPRGASVAESLAAAGPGEADFARCDVRSGAEVSSAVERAVEASGRIDVLVNNAAIALGGNIAEMPEDDWNRVIDTNLSGAYRTIHAVLPHMRRRKSGCILNLTSVQGQRSWPDWTAYAAAKGGLAAMTRQLAGQFGAEGIRVNAICPGSIDTPMNQRRVEREGEHLLAAWRRMHALKRTGKPREVARLAVFLASEDGAFISGEEINVDGGLATLPLYYED